jgi:hypothetical protein
MVPLGEQDDGLGPRSVPPADSGRDPAAGAHRIPCAPSSSVRGHPVAVCGRRFRGLPRGSGGGVSVPGGLAIDLVPPAAAGQPRPDRGPCGKTRSRDYASAPPRPQLPAHTLPDRSIEILVEVRIGQRKRLAGHAPAPAAAARRGTAARPRQRRMRRGGGRRGRRWAPTP